MVPTAATPSRSRSAPVVGRVPVFGMVALVTVVVVPGPVPFGLPPGLPPGEQWLPWQEGGLQWLPWQPGGVQWLPWHGGGVQWLPWQGGGQLWSQHWSWQGGGQWCSHGGQLWSQHCSWQDGWLQSWPMQDEEPPLQSELAKPPTAPETPQTFTGTLIGAVTVLPDTTGML